MTDSEFAQALQELRETLFKYALTLTSDTADAEDLVQQTLVKALEKRSMFVNENLGGWLSVILRNLYLNNRKRNRRMEPLDITAMEWGGATAKQMVETQTPESELTLREILQDIKALPALMRIPFELYLAGYKYEEIALRLDLPVGTVKSRIHNARKTLRAHIKP